VTEPREKPMITSDRIAWFAAYLRQHPSWGIFHTSLNNENFHIGAEKESWSRSPWTVAEREAATWFDQLSPSQRRRLRHRAEDLAANVLWKEIAP
jgi:hypothetical protein